jgi:hypothetical protein
MLMNRRDALHRIAPGYNPSGLLVPKSKAAASGSGSDVGSTLGGVVALNLMGDGTPPAIGDRATNVSADPMEDLVGKLEEMESRRT